MKTYQEFITESTLVSKRWNMIVNVKPSGTEISMADPADDELEHAFSSKETDEKAVKQLVADADQLRKVADVVKLFTKKGFKHEER